MPTPFDGVLKLGTTRVNIYGRSPIIENDDASCTAVVDEELNVVMMAIE